jgi:putative glycosyltransferase
MKLSIVTTLYQSSSYIKEFCERASDASRKLVGEDFEIILVNDGSPDDSLQIAVDLSKTLSNWLDFSMLVVRISFCLIVT